MLWDNLDLRHLIDEEGNIGEEQLSSQAQCIAEAEKLMLRTLGCTIVIEGREFILSNLELYYGSIGDRAHDWWRVNYSKSRGISKEHTAYQLLSGPKIYKKTKGCGNRNRADIVVGPEGVALSFLIRNVWDVSGQRMGKLDGSPGMILGEDILNITDDMVGKSIELIDTHNKYVSSEDQIIKSKRYIGGKGYCGFPEAFEEKLWNFRIAEK